MLIPDKGCTLLGVPFNYVSFDSNFPHVDYLHNTVHTANDHVLNVVAVDVGNHNAGDGNVVLELQLVALDRRNLVGMKW